MLSKQSIKTHGSPSHPFVSHHHHQLIHQPSFDNHFSRHPKTTASTNLKMKFFTTLLSMVTLTSAAAVNYDFYAPVDALAKREAAAALSFDPAHDPLSARGDEDVNIITASLDDGAEKVEIIVDGVSQGYLIVSPDGDGNPTPFYPLKLPNETNPSLPQSKASTATAPWSTSTPSSPLVTSSTLTSVLLAGSRFWLDLLPSSQSLANGLSTG